MDEHCFISEDEIELQDEQQDMELSDIELLEKLLDWELEEQCSLLQLRWLQLELKLEELLEQQGTMQEHEGEIMEEELQ